MSDKYNKNYYYVRHGETGYNLLKKAAGGRIDCKLSESGVQQAQILKDKISELDISTVISSPLIRAKQTAEIIRPHEIIYDKDLKELDLGDFTGLSNEECIAKVGSFPFSEALPNGESKDAFQRRIVTAIEKNLSIYKSPILFVGHGFAYATLLQYYELPIKRLDNCSITKFYIENNKWTVKYL